MAGKINETFKKNLSQWIAIEKKLDKIRPSPTSRGNGKFTLWNH